mmetsp:Transcript_38090/g.119551  ORF Transcript_38090/g.119551 Transcript_38090/m.119551 type:complete len:273 (-) Transcript_38090:82-900(-)
MPVLTAGGSSAAAMAMPTMELTWLFVSAMATAMPPQTATMAPNSSSAKTPRSAISCVGQKRSSAKGMKMMPMTKPMATVAKSAMDSLRTPTMKSVWSCTARPKLAPRSGPMSGDMSMDATTSVRFDVASPKPATMELMQSSTIMSKLSTVCRPTFVMTCPSQSAAGLLPATSDMLCASHWLPRRRSRLFVTLWMSMTVQLSILSLNLGKFSRISMRSKRSPSAHFTWNCNRPSVVWNTRELSARNVASRNELSSSSCHLSAENCSSFMVGWG